MAKKSVIDTIKGMFKPKLSPEEQRRQAELDYRMQSRAFKKYEIELDKMIGKFKGMAIECQNKGQKSNALRAARFVRQLTHTRDKVVGVSQHFEMLHVMSGVGDIMVQFMNACAKVGCDLSEQIDVTGLGAGELSMREGLSRLDFMSDKIEQAFELISDQMDMFGGDVDVETASAEDVEMLNSLLAEAGMPVAESKPAEAAPAEKPVVEEVKPEEEPEESAQAKKIAALTRKFDKVGS